MAPATVLTKVAVPPLHAEVPSDDDAWTFVHRSKKTFRRMETNDPKMAAWLKKTSRSHTYSARKPAIYSMDHILKDGEEAVAAWKASYSYKALCDFLDDKAFTMPLVTSAFCLGSGPFSSKCITGVQSRTAHVQIAAFQLIVDVLEKRTQIPIQRFIQDPAYGELDKQYIAQHHPALVLCEEGKKGAYSLITNTSLVFGVHLYLPDAGRALARDLPGVYIGTGPEQWDPFVATCTTTAALSKPTWFDERDLHVLLTMAAESEKFVFPDFENVFSTTAVFWRQPEPEAAAGRARVCESSQSSVASLQQPPPPLEPALGAQAACAGECYMPREEGPSEQRDRTPEVGPPRVEGIKRRWQRTNREIRSYGMGR